MSADHLADRAGAGASPRGRLDEAALAREAADLAEQTDALEWQGHALLAVAEVLQLRGRRGEALGYAEEALGRFETKGLPRYAAKARAFVAELRAQPPATA